MLSNDPQEKNREKRRQDLWQQDLGMPAPEWLEESLAPPITDKEMARLKKYAGNEITCESEHAEITALTFRFRSWSEALLRIYDEINQRLD